MTPGFRRISALAAAVFIAAAVWGIAYATIPDGGGVYTACKLNATGTIRLIDPSLPATSLLSRCTSYETKITWSQKGVPGAAGTNGTNGTNGIDGINGIDGPKGDPCLPIDPACVGPRGEAGADGADGNDGVDGTNGVDGTDGGDGAPGAQGDPCLPEIPGCEGPQGPQGPRGLDGPAGAPGSGATLASLDSLDGIACNSAGAAGTVQVTYGPPPGGVITLTCLPAEAHTLTVSTAGTGIGTVTSDIAGISCGTTCSHSYTVGTVVSLTVASTADVFTGWSGACSGTGSCTVTMNAAASVTATFVPGAELSIAQSGGRYVTVPCGFGCTTTTAEPKDFEISSGSAGVFLPTGNPGIACKYTYGVGQSGACTHRFSLGAAITLTIIRPGFGLGGASMVATWGGACEGATGNSCTLTLDDSNSVTVTYAAP